MAMDSHHRRVTCRWLRGRSVDGRTSSAASFRRVCSRWYRRVCCLGLPFPWQSFFGSVAALAGHSWLVHRGRYIILVWFTMTPMPPRHQRAMKTSRIIQFVVAAMLFSVGSVALLAGAPYAVSTICFGLPAVVLMSRAAATRPIPRQ